MVRCIIVVDEAKNNTNYVFVSGNFNDLSIQIFDQKSFSLFLLLKSSLKYVYVYYYVLRFDADVYTRVQYLYLCFFFILVFVFFFFFYTTITVRFYCQTPRLYFQLAKLCKTYYNNSCDKNNIYIHTVH